MNLKETENKLEVELAATGMKKEDFKVEIDNNMIMISSEKQEKKTITFEKSFVINLSTDLSICPNM